MRYVLVFLLLISAIRVSSQTAIKGFIFDKQSQQPLTGANVILVSVQPQLGTISDLEGLFQLDEVLPGRHVIQVSYLGYNAVTIPNVLVTSGKQVVLEVGLEESAISMDEIVVTATVEKDKSNNEMATVSARMFTLEEVTRYSGGRNDASRMAANFAGVNIADDSRNDIVIRGNSPIGVLWRMEGIPIPNPNHFATMGTTGGPVSALNTNLLKNSDFLTGAFPAEYGNANAGVFDIQLRSGNRDRYEFTAQLAAFSGFEMMAEGPLSKRNKGSFLVSYRHSFVELAHYAGINVGTSALPRYKDLTFKVDLGRTRTGQWSIFGLGGLSDIEFLAEETEDDDFFAASDQNSRATSQIGIMGLNHQLLLNDRSYVRTTLAYSYAGNAFNAEEIVAGTDINPIFDSEDKTSRLTLSSYLNKKVNAKLTYRTGMLLEYHLVDAFVQEKNIGVWQILRDFDDGIPILQAYGQIQYKPREQVTINAGVHGQYLQLNQQLAIEPRASINWHLSPNQTLSLGYGRHNQMLPLPLALLTRPNPNGSLVRTNEDVQFLTSDHFILSYDRKIGPDWRIKSEVYFQHQHNIPVESTASSFSALNAGADFGFPEVHYLMNSGTGKNYGLELTVEKFFSKGFYALCTGSLYDSKYKGSDGVEEIRLLITGIF
ncbi:MAG: TonB-dependent receptor [Saprospiraceae bacterium]|nr:TonB-dependent receptor [Saprospiraceae bacterium]